MKSWNDKIRKEEIHTLAKQIIMWIIDHGIYISTFVLPDMARNVFREAEHNPTQRSPILTCLLRMNIDFAGKIPLQLSDPQFPPA